MATRLYTRNAVLLAKIETTEGTDPTPTGALNAILCSELSVSPLEGSTVDLAYVRPYFGKSPSLRVEDFVTISMTCDLAGVIGASIAAPWGPLIRACGMAETLLSTAVTGTATGGTSTSVTLAAGSSAVDGVYAGATISITSGTGSGQSRTIISYNGSSKVATVSKAFATTPTAGSGYSIGANSSYSPVSTAFESVTLYFNQNGVRHKATGCRGNVSFDLTSNQRPTLKFTFTGIYNAVADASETGVIFTNWQVPVAVNSINSSALIQGKQADGSASGVQLMSFSLDMGNAVTHRMLVGSENVVLTDRQSQGSVSIEATTVAFNDWWSQVRASTKSPFLIENGTAAGNTCSILLPNAQLTDPKYSDSDGIVMLDQSILALPTVGNDEIRLVVK